MINNEFEITYFSENPKEWLKTLDGLLTLFLSEKKEKFYQFRNFIYFFIESNGQDHKEKVVFKLDDTHILFRISKKELNMSEKSDIQHYIEEKGKWKQLSEFPLSKIQRTPFFIYYKEKNVYKAYKNGAKYSFIADNVFFVDSSSLDVVQNVKYIEIESDDIRSLNEYQKYFDDYFKNSDFTGLVDNYSKYYVCKKSLSPWHQKITSVYELENLLNRIFTKMYLHNIESK